MPIQRLPSAHHACGADDRGIARSAEHYQSRRRTPTEFSKPGTNLITPIWLRHLPLERVTLAEQLKGAGYATGFVGKWHLSHRSRSDSGPDGKLPTEAQLRPEHQGFDVNIGGCNYGGPPSYFSPYRIPNLEGKADGEYLPDRSADDASTSSSQLKLKGIVRFSFVGGITQFIIHSRLLLSWSRSMKKERSGHRESDIRSND